MMELDVNQGDRAAGALLGLACGDALGVPYEFAQPPGPGELAVMSGGGLGNFAPGEWSDDTSMAVAIAQARDHFGSDRYLDAVAEGFLRWYDDDPPDIGIQTSMVLSATRRRLDGGAGRTAAVMREEAEAYAQEKERAAGNGALMRTAPVALVCPADRERTAATARDVAMLTHADPLAVDSCVLWTEAIRVAVLDGRIDVAGGLDLIAPENRERWRGWLADSVARPAVEFTPNGYTVTALQAALAAITQTPEPAHDPQREYFPHLHLQDALHAAVRIGDDTDTVAAIAGGLLGARWGASAVPSEWLRVVHGWPGLDSHDLIALGTIAVRGGLNDGSGWPRRAQVN